MAYAFIMAVGDSREQLLNDVCGVLLIELTSLYDLVEELAALAVLGD